MFLYGVIVPVIPFALESKDHVKPNKGTIPHSNEVIELIELMILQSNIGFQSSSPFMPQLY